MFVLVFLSLKILILSSVKVEEGHRHDQGVDHHHDQEQVLLLALVLLLLLLVLFLSSYIKCVVVLKMKEDRWSVFEEIFVFVLIS